MTDTPSTELVAMPEVPRITVTYERKLSDGNYGSEGYSFSVTAAGNPEYFAEDNFAHIAAGLRTAVLAELSHSAAPRVASAARFELSPPNPSAAPRVAGEPDFEDR